MLRFITRTSMIAALVLTVMQTSFGQDRFLSNQEIEHTVVKGQTLYSIAKGYQLKVEDLGIDNAISPAQVIKVPILAEGSERLDLILSKLQKSPRTHIVLPKETVFALSKKYGITVDQLKEWNNLADNNIGIDQTITVGWTYKTANSGVLILPTVKPITGNKPVIGNKPVVVSRPKQSVNKQDMLYQKYLADKEGRSSASVKGAANWFKTENRMMASNYYGMLSNVPVGSIVEVINPQNGKKVYVKIIGGLPDTAENTGATIKLTPIAQTALQAGDAKLQVTVNYYK